MEWRKSERGWKSAFIDAPDVSMPRRRQGAVFRPISSIEDLNELADDLATTTGASLTHLGPDSEGGILQFIHRDPAGVGFIGTIRNPVVAET